MRNPLSEATSTARISIERFFFLFKKILNANIKRSYQALIINFTFVSLG
jgi:hypothetical protein